MVDSPQSMDNGLSTMDDLTQLVHVQFPVIAPESVPLVAVPLNVQLLPDRVMLG